MRKHRKKPEGKDHSGTSIPSRKEEEITKKYIHIKKMRYGISGQYKGGGSIQNNNKVFTEDEDNLFEKIEPHKKFNT